MANLAEMRMRRYEGGQQREREQRWLNGDDPLTPFQRRRLALYQRRQAVTRLGEEFMEVGAPIEEVRRAFALLGQKVLEQLQPALEQVDVAGIGQVEIEDSEGMQNLYAAMGRPLFGADDE